MSIYHKSYRCCFVPLCANTTKTEPNKLFFCVPVDKKTRALWFRIVRRKGKPSTSHFFCCEDHFNLHDDMENYIRFSLMGGRAKLKPTVVPHIFECQSDRKITSNKKRPWTENKQRRSAVNDILSEAEHFTKSNNLELEENQISNINHRYTVYLKTPTYSSSSVAEVPAINAFVKTELKVEEDSYSDEVDPLQLPDLQDCKNEFFYEQDQGYSSSMNEGFRL